MVTAAALGFYTSGGSAPGLLLGVTLGASAPCSHEAANVAGRSAGMGTERRDLVSAAVPQSPVLGAGIETKGLLAHF